MQEFFLPLTVSFDITSAGKYSLEGKSITVNRYMTYQAVNCRDVTVTVKLLQAPQKEITYSKLGFNTT